MAAARHQSADLRRPVASSSPRNKGRENKDTLCRNVLIYGHCRYQDQGCTFNHTQNKSSANKQTPATVNMSNANNQADNAKKFNVDSPSFTPASIQGGGKKAAFSTQAANAPSFTPRGPAATSPRTRQSEAAAFNPAAIREFTPGFDGNHNGSSHEPQGTFDPFSMPAVNPGITTPQFNPYAEEHGLLNAGGPAFYHPPGPFQATLQPLQHHLYFPGGRRRDDLMPYHRVTHDFFIPEDMRIDIVKKMEATAQVMPNLQLPQLEHYHSLVPLDTNNQKSTSAFGYASWVYKAFGAKNGHTYCLRRLEGYRLTNEFAIRSVKEWRRIENANVVSVLDAFTTRIFGDSSIVFVHNYFPLAKTLAETYFSSSTTQGGRFQAKTPIIESVLWSFITQIANAIRAIHSINLAARCIDITKIILTDKTRIRLSACSILDVTQFEQRKPLGDVQQEDLTQFGRTILALATNTLPSQITNVKTSLDQMSRVYSNEITETAAWLVTPPQPQATKTIEDFMRGISGHIMGSLDESLQLNDEVYRITSQEVENGRIARLLLKLGAVNERPEHDNDRSWSENGERYLLKLFRDYVFHQVDSKGNPVLDIGHMIRCMNKLDASTEERICLISRDEQTSFVVSYKELRKQLNNAFSDLQQGAKGRSGGF